MGKSRFHLSAHCAAALLVCALGCGSPFFPDTGVPLKDTSRATPEGVVRQLVKAYENQRIDLFEELLYSEKEFRFYVELDINIYAEFNNIQTSRTERVELNSDYFPNGDYVYLTYNEEKSIHTKLFRQARDIVFEPSLEVLSVEYLHSFDGREASSDTGDASIAVVRTDNTTIGISADVIESVYGEASHSFPVGKQVFYLKKDTEGLWRILLWFELDSV